MSYSKQTWHDSPTADTPITAARLGHLEDGVAAAYAFDPTGTDWISTDFQALGVEADAARDTDIATAVSQARSGVLLSTDQPLLSERGNCVTSGEQTMQRDAISANFNLTASTLFLTYFTAQQSRTGLTTIAVCTAGTAASPAPTLAKLALYSVDSGTGDLTLIAASTNDTALFTVANTVYPKTIASSSITKGARYAIGALQVGGTTAPKLYGVALTGALLADSPAIALQLAAQSDMPSTATAASLVSTTGKFWARLS